MDLLGVEILKILGGKFSIILLDWKSVLVVSRGLLGSYLIMIGFVSVYISLYILFFLLIINIFSAAWFFPCRVVFMSLVRLYRVFMFAARLDGGFSWGSVYIRSGMSRWRIFIGFL